MRYHEYHNDLADDFYYGDDYLYEAYGPTARDAALFGETDHIHTMIEEGHMTEEEGRAALDEIYTRYNK